MKTFVKFTLLLVALFHFNNTAAQLVVNAGNDTTVCSGATVILGGNPTASGGTPPYQYLWSNSVVLETTVIVASTNSIMYLWVTDSLGATATDTVTVFVNPNPVIDSIITTDVSCFGDSTGTLCAFVSGGTAPYSYTNFTWSALQATTQCINNLWSGIDSVYVTDANGCSAVPKYVNIRQAPPLTAQLTSTQSGIPYRVGVLASGGTIPYQYSWFDGFFGMSVRNFSCPFSVSVLVRDVNGCRTETNTIILEDTCINNCVWPGDADNNEIVDNNDLLPIGLAYGANGLSRCTIANNWRAFASEDWADTLASGTNYKHTDCDGNSVVNADDTLAIIQNFGLTSLKNNQSKPWRMSAPALLVDLIPDTVLAGETLVANLILGDINIPANDVYGLAFTLNYDANVVDSTQTSIVFGNSWLGTASEKISIAKDLPQQGAIKCAVTRIDKNTRSGLGIIGQASFIITTDNINGKNELAYTDMKVWISDLKVIDNQGQILEVNEGSDSTQVGFEPVSVTEKPLSLNELIIQPNPATNEVFISVSDNLLSGTLTVVDTEGKIVFSKTITTHANKIQTTDFANGVYFVKVISEKGVLTKRLAIVK
jgi:hypothetical protein